MSIEFVFYFIELISNFRDILLFFVICYFAFIVMNFIWIQDSFIEGDLNEEDCIKKIKNIVRKHIKYFLLILFFIFIMPSQKTMYLMLSSHYLKQSELPQKISLVIEKKLDEIIHSKDK